MPEEFTAIRVRATQAEKDYLKKEFGDMSGVIRSAIREKLEKDGINNPENFFFDRPPGNWTSGNDRKGYKKIAKE